jgi:hypothetical protein
LLEKTKLVSKALDFVRWQGVSRFKSGAYTLVREHFKATRNTVSGQKMRFLKPVLVREAMTLLLLRSPQQHS